MSRGSFQIILWQPGPFSFEKGDTGRFALLIGDNGFGTGCFALLIGDNGFGIGCFALLIGDNGFGTG